MNVLSLFDGMSCGRIALERAGILVTNYFASEIDPYAIKVSKANWPDIVQLGSVTEIGEFEYQILPKINLLIGGSPCQGFSFAGKGLNFEDPRSKLFFEYVRILKEVKPKYFLLENVNMLQDHQDIISEFLGVKPIFINSRLVSAQDRKRLYWTNIPVLHAPKDMNLTLKHVVEYNITKTMSPITAKRPRALRNYRSLDEKSFCLVSTMYKQAQANGMTNVNTGWGLRCITPLECERLQTLPDNYTSICSNTQRYKMIGNGWTVDVIAHIFKSIPID